MENLHPQATWWREVCGRFVDTSRSYSNTHFRDVTSSGVIAGGDWYVIHGGRQDYVNYYHNCLEVTMEISTVKTLSSDRLPEYWRFLAPSFINYIAEIHNLPEGEGISGQWSVAGGQLSVYPNPFTDYINVEGVADGSPIELYDCQGRLLLTASRFPLSTRLLPKGVYLLRVGDGCVKVIKK